MKKRKLHSTRNWLMVVLLAAAVVPSVRASGQSAEVPPVDGAPPAHLIPFDPPGTLVICGGGELPEDVRKFFVRAAGGKKARIIVIPTASIYADTETELYWTEDWIPLEPESVSVLHTRDRAVADSEEFVKKIESASGIWFSGGDQSRLSEVFLDTRAQVAFENFALRGGTIGGTSAGAAICSEVMIASGQETPEMSRGLNLLPWAITDQHFTQRDRIGRLRKAVAQNPSRVGLGIDESTAVIVNGRSMRVMGEGNARIVFAETGFAPAQELKIGPQDRLDWMTFVRQARERSQPVFPGNEQIPVNFPKGSLVIVGGGQIVPEIASRFVELAGGADAKIVVLPTATTRPPQRAGEEDLFQTAGAGTVLTLPQIRLEDIESETCLAHLRSATGIWFGGGRQWNFVDHYEGTRALEEMHNCLKRGGVIGGSSAGASIIGDLLIRGAPVGNQIMVQDGYRRGFAFLPGVGIDQHFSQRDRSPDLTQVIADYPSITGIGIDESTALVVTPESAEVIGKGSVFIIRLPDADPGKSLQEGIPVRPEVKELQSGESQSLENAFGSVIRQGLSSKTACDPCRDRSTGSFRLRRKSCRGLPLQSPRPAFLCGRNP